MTAFFLNANGTFNRSAIFRDAWRSARGRFLPFSHFLRQSWHRAKVERADWNRKRAPAAIPATPERYGHDDHTFAPLTGLRAALFAAECIDSYRESSRDQARIRAAMH